MIAAPAGPWDAALVVDVELPLRSKSNFRRSRHSAAWREMHDFQTFLRARLAAARPSTWPALDPAAPVAARPTVVVVIRAVTLLDTGNLSKSVLDAGEGILYVTDAQVACEWSQTVARRRSAQRARLAFAALPPCTAPEVVSAAVVALAAAAGSP